MSADDLADRSCRCARAIAVTIERLLIKPASPPLARAFAGSGVAARRMYARRLSQAAKRNALQRRCEIDPLSGTPSCTSVDDYHMSLPRTTSTSLMIGNSSLRASLDRHRLLGIEPVVDPISPMLHQLRARTEKRERSAAMSNFGRAARQSTSVRFALGWRPRHRSCGPSAQFRRSE